MSLLDLDQAQRALDDSEPLAVRGRVVRATGLVVEATLPTVAVGTACEIGVGNRRISAEVVGFNGQTALLMPVGGMTGICEGAWVLPRLNAGQIPAGDAVLGRVVDAAVRPLDGGPDLLLRERVPIHQAPPSPMSRQRICRPLALGIRSVDSCLTLGEGQRLAVMAGPGVGKSVLLGMVAKHAAVDVIVVGLIGERGREVREFVERDLGEKGLARAVVVVATAEEPPLMRLRAAMTATALGESFRRRGKRVLLLMDSLSRVAMAQREIGLAAGEPPTSKGYPPSVFSVIPKLVERAGNDSGTGTLTALYTVLAEGDDLTDPIVDAARAALDGHLVLSRKLAGAGHFPAVDILSSVSRVMTDVVSPEHLELARRAREALSAYAEAQDLVEVGAYVAGSNPKVDRALKCIHAVQAFLKQGPDEPCSLADSLALLGQALGPAAEVGRA